MSIFVPSIISRGEWLLKDYEKRGKGGHMVNVFGVEEFDVHFCTINYWKRGKGGHVVNVFGVEKFDVHFQEHLRYLLLSCSGLGFGD